MKDQARDFLARLGPESRGKVLAGFHQLAREAGNVKAMEGPLDGFYRLRVGRYRVIFHYVQGPQGPKIQCVYANTRSLVYEVFAQRLQDYLGG